MGIEANHVDYQKYENSWTRCADAIDGSDAIKGKTTKYLPMLPGMKRTGDGQELYNLYLDNALWYPGTGRTNAAYLGSMFRKEPSVEMPAGMEEAKNIFTPEGQTINGFAVELSAGVISGYRPGILVDYPDIDTEGMTKAEAEAAGARPYALMYQAIQIVNWKQKVINGALKTVLVVLEEHVPIEEYKERYSNVSNVNGKAKIRRSLSLNGEVYTQSLYILMDSKKGVGTEYVLISTKVPKVKGNFLNMIPFIPVTTAGLVWDLGYPLINDIAVLNISDYKNEALYRDALLFNGRPTPCVSGLIVSANQNSIELGSSTVLQFETDGKWGTLGGGADSVGLKDSGNDLKQKMALVGSRALSEDPRGVEAAETASIHRQGEDGVLSAVANSVSAGITKALEIMREWFDVDGDVSYKISNDFLPADVDPARMTAAWQMYVAGDMSFSAFYAFLERGEVYPAGWTEEKELEAQAGDVERKTEEPEPIDESAADPSV